MMNHILRCLCLGAFLTACSQAPEPANGEDVDSASEAAATEAEAENQPTASTDEDSVNLERLAENPQALRDAMRDPEQRESLMQAMRERREARRNERDGEDGNVDHAAVRERMRERRAELMAERGVDGADPREQLRQRRLERDRWWTDQDLQASIGLAEAQAEALTQAQVQMENQRQTMQQHLGEQQRALMAAVREADRSSILDLIEQRASTQQSLQDLELQWWQILLDELSDEQLAALAEQNAQILMRRGGR